MRSSSSIQSDASSWDDELHSPLTPVVPALSLDPSFDIFPSSRPRVDCEPFDYDSLDRRRLIDTVASFIYETAVLNSPEELESRARNEYTDPVTVMLTSESSRSLCVPPRTIAKHLGQLPRIREISNESLVKMLLYTEKLEVANRARNGYSKDGRDAFTLKSTTISLFFVALTLVATKSECRFYLGTNAPQKRNPCPYYAELARWARMTEDELYVVEANLAMSSYRNNTRRCYFEVYEEEMQACVKKYL